MAQVTDLALAVEVNPVDTLKLLHNPSKGGLSSRLFALVAHGLVLVLEGVAQLAFGQGVDHQGECHNQGEGLDPLGLFDKDTTDKEEWVFEEAKPSLYGLLSFIFLQ